MMRALNSPLGKSSIYSIKPFFIYSLQTTWNHVVLVMIELDLKTLKAIHIVHMTGSVSRAAEVLDVSPGGVSYLINKARAATGAALFVRTREGMQADSLAQELSARYQIISNELSSSNEEGVLGKKTLIISSYSLAELLISLTVLDDVIDYPELVFHRQLYDDNERLVKLRNKEVDLDVGTRLPADKSITQLSFFIGNARVLARKNHSTISDEIKLSDWQNNKHAVWLRGMHFINKDFEKTHLFNELLSQKNVAFTSSSSLNLINLCMLSDTLVLVPELVGNKLGSLIPVRVHLPPAELDMQFECYIHYHRSLSGDVSIKRIIDLLHKSFGAELC